MIQSSCASDGSKFSLHNVHSRCFTDINIQFYDDLMASQVGVYIGILCFAMCKRTLHITLPVLVSINFWYDKMHSHS